MRRLQLLILCLLVLPPRGLNAQHLSPHYREADSIWLTQLLYSGVEWRPKYLSVPGNEFFLSAEFLTGSVTVSGIEFRNLRMRYDICNDNVIILWHNSLPLIIRGEGVDGFTIIFDGTPHRFINLHDRFSETGGFAEVLYEGESSLVIKHSKVLSGNYNPALYSGFTEYTRYYFISAGVCTQFRSPKGLFELMGIYGPQVKKYLRKNGVAAGAANPYGYVMAAEYYDSLTGGRKEE